MRGMDYTPEEDQFIIQNCLKMTCAEMAFRIGRSQRDNIRQRVIILRRLGKLKRLGHVRNGVFHPIYSKEEDEIIKELYPVLGSKALVNNHLHRTRVSIKSRAARLRVKKIPPVYFNIVKIAKLFAVNSRVVRGWLKQGFLKGSKSGRGKGLNQEWRVEPEDLEKFARDYYYLYDPNRVKDKFLLSIIETTPAGKSILIRQAVKVLGVSRIVIQRRINKGTLKAYKGFGGNIGRGGFRWYVQLAESESDLEWFRDLADNNNGFGAARWLVETVRQGPDSVELLNILIKYEPERIRLVRVMISEMAPAADRILKEFEASQEGEKLKNLSEKGRGLIPMTEGPLLFLFYLTENVTIIE